MGTKRSQRPETVVFMVRHLPVRLRQRLRVLAAERHWPIGHTHTVVLEKGLDVVEAEVEDGPVPDRR